MEHDFIIETISLELKRVLNWMGFFFLEHWPKIPQIASCDSMEFANIHLILWWMNGNYFWKICVNFLLLLLSIQFSFRICSFQITSKSFKYFIIQNQRDDSNDTLNKKHWLNVAPNDSDEDWKDFLSVSIWFDSIWLVMFQCSPCKSNIVTVMPNSKICWKSRTKDFFFHASLSVAVKCLFLHDEKHEVSTTML